MKKTFISPKIKVVKVISNPVLTITSGIDNNGKSMPGANDNESAFPGGGWVL